MSATGSPHQDATPAVGPYVEGVRWRYYSGYYDGPLSGMVVLPDGAEAWAQCIEECSCPRWNDDELTDEEMDEAADEPPVHGFYRRYQLTTLSPEAAATEAERHADFRRWVGEHTDIGEDGRREVGAVHPRETHHLFYDKWSKRNDARTENGTPLGWWQW